MYNEKEFDIYINNQIKIFVMKNLKKLKNSELKTIKGGAVPLGCNNWNPLARCCRVWDSEHESNPTCPTP